ncbi:hypothetical protein T4C_2414 [Trichinella pseudospiralis]|uniref:DUF5641 domain-containing protein n=1 Tax=Trichinella pseudospiralis TaxID=6337 RepID=A0A0V1JDG7_TRIPS|nr:hypothetical protein T4C_2414 [Trichinella pseudospiralis]
MNRKTLFECVRARPETPLTGTYLQTAKAYLYAPNGPQRLFVAKNVADSLRLNGYSECGITPNSQAKQIYCDVYCVSRLCDTQEDNPPVIWEHVKDLNFADDFPRDRCEFDVLIRMDYYYHFIEDDGRTVDDGCLIQERAAPQCDCERYRRIWKLESIIIMDQPVVESPIERIVTINRERLSSHKTRQMEIVSRAEARYKATALTVSVIKENKRLDPSRFSKFERLVRITAFGFRFLRNLKLPRHEENCAELSVSSGRNPIGKLATFNPYLDENGLETSCPPTIGAPSSDAAYKKSSRTVAAFRKGTDYAIISARAYEPIMNDLPTDRIRYLALIQSDNFGIFKQADRELQDLFDENHCIGYREYTVRRRRATDSVLPNRSTCKQPTCDFIVDDPGDPNPLTPFHFLIGRGFRNVYKIYDGEDDDLTYPEPQSQMNCPDAGDDEYIVNLSQRKKWTTNEQEPRIRGIVLVAEDGVPTHKWPMARLAKVYPGGDGVIRTVRVKKLKGTYNRPARFHELAVDSDGLRPSQGVYVTDNKN